jgi:hypothetical protein
MVIALGFLLSEAVPGLTPHIEPCHHPRLVTLCATMFNIDGGNMVILSRRPVNCIVYSMQKLSTTGERVKTASYELRAADCRSRTCNQLGYGFPTSVCVIDQLTHASQASLQLCLSRRYFSWVSISARSKTWTCCKIHATLAGTMVFGIWLFKSAMLEA